MVKTKRARIFIRSGLAIGFLLLAGSCSQIPPAIEPQAPGAPEPVVEAAPPTTFFAMHGRLLIEGKDPMPGGVVSFFDSMGGPPPNQGNVRRIPELVTSVGNDGVFTAQLLAGKYYLGTLNRTPEQGPGPPRPGEKLYFAMDEAGGAKILEVRADGSRDFGDIMVVPSLAFRELADYFTVEGIVRDEAGQPVGDAMLMIKIDLNSPKPDMISANTDAAGRYRIRLPAGRPYHFIARNTISPGRPNIGGYVGTYNGPTPVIDPESGPDSAPVPATVSGKPGEVVSGIDITVFAVPDPAAIKKQKQDEIAREGQPE